MSSETTPENQGPLSPETSKDNTSGKGTGKTSIDKSAVKPSPKKKSRPKKKPSSAPNPKIVEKATEPPVVQNTPLPSKAPTPVKRSEEIPSKIPQEDAPRMPREDAVAPAPPVAEAKAMPKSEKIWESVKSRQIQMFGLPNQFINSYCEYSPVETDRCFLKYRVAAVVPALEAVAPEFNIEAVQGYIILSVKPAPLR